MSHMLFCFNIPVNYSLRITSTLPIIKDIFTNNAAKAGERNRTVKGEHI